MRKVAEGDTEALEHLYLSFAPALMSSLAERGADQDLCDQLVQKIFADLWKKRADFRAQSSFEAYFFAIAKNTLHKEIKRARDATQKSRRNYRASPDQLWNDLSEPEAITYRKEFTAAVKRAKAKLTDKQRHALEASQAEDMPFSELSKKLGCSYGAFEKRLQRARKRMRELLECFLNDRNDSDRLGGK